MITYKVGDLFDTDLPVILHGCNAHGVMGAGVAKVVRDKYPDVYLQYKKWCDSYADNPRELLGQWYTVRTERHAIVNAITQLDFGPGKRQVSYDAIDEVFADMNNLFHLKISGIAIPKIGAGLGGGDWTIIETIIKQRMFNVPVTVYTLD